MVDQNISQLTTVKEEQKSSPVVVKTTQSVDLVSQITTTEKGLRIVRVAMPGVQSVTVLALAGTGSRYEEASVRGLSHFLEHMVFKGTASYADSHAVAMAIDAVGAEFNAFTSKEYTGYYVKAPATAFRLAVDVVSDMLMTPSLRQEDIDRERQVIEAEIDMYEDTPSRKVGDVFEQVMFDGCDLGEDIIGTKETVRAITREAFVSHLKKWYGPSNLVVVVAGDAQLVESAEVIEQIELAFSKTSETSSREEKRGMVRPAKYATSKYLKVINKKTEQAHLVMGVPGLAHDDERWPALSVLATLFGGGMSSRLFTEIREKRGLCYYVRSDLEKYHDAGVFGVSAGVDPKRIEEALSAILAELRLLSSSGERAITEDEVARAKEQVLGRLALSTEDSYEVAAAAGMRQLLQRKPFSLEEKRQKIRSVTHQQVLELAQSLVQDTQPYLAVIGPFEQEDIFKTMLASS